MHQQLKDKGVVVVSVSVDKLDDETTLDTIKKSLIKNKMTMTNYLLDEPEEKWQEKLGVIGVPVVYVFNKAGKIEAKFIEGKKDKEIDEAVDRALKEKAP